MGMTCSPGTWSGSRVVVINVSLGAARRTSATSGATSPRRCSQLSRTSNMPVLQVGEQDLQRLDCGLVAEVQGCEHGVGHQGPIANLGQLDQPGAVREATSQVGRNA